MSLVIEGEHLHRLCLMCNPIGYCIIKFMHFIQWNIWIELKIELDMFHLSYKHFPHSLLITGFVTRLTRRVPLLEQELLTLPVFSGIRVTRSLVLCVWFIDSCLSFCTFLFGHCGVCSSSTYGFWLPLWYLQTLLISGFIRLWLNVL